MADFLAAISGTVRPGTARPVVVHADELETLPAGRVHNPTTLAIAGRLPTATFELFRQTIPPGESSDMQRHYHETVHYVISGRGHSEIEDDTEGWAAGDFIYTPPWTWHRHYNDSADEPVEFLTIENSRLLQALGIARRQSAGLAPSPRRAPDSRRSNHDRPARAHQHLGRAGRHRPRAAPRRRAACAPACCAPALVPTWCCCRHRRPPGGVRRDIAGLAADFRVTAYDMVGHGWSDLPDRPYTIDVLADHLTGLMDELDIGAAHLSGESLGGWVAAWAAAHHPDRVSRLVLNTPGNIVNKPEVMARLRESTLAAVRDPSDATVRRRVESCSTTPRWSPTSWSRCAARSTAGPVPARDHQHARAAGSRGPQGLRLGTGWAARSARRPCCYGPTMTRPAG